MLLSSQLCFDLFIPKPPGRGHVYQIQLKSTQLSEGLHIGLCWGELGCTSLKNLVSSFLEDKDWHFKSFSSCRIGAIIYHPVHAVHFMVWILAPDPTNDINRDNTTLLCNCFCSIAVQLLILIQMSKSEKFYGVLQVLTHWFSPALLMPMFLSPSEKPFPASLSPSPERAATSLVTPHPAVPAMQGPYMRDKTWYEGSCHHCFSRANRWKLMQCPPMMQRNEIWCCFQFWCSLSPA